MEDKENARSFTAFAINGNSPGKVTFKIKNSRITDINIELKYKGVSVTSPWK
jgi:hypothetical protein